MALYPCESLPGRGERDGGLDIAVGVSAGAAEFRDDDGPSSLLDRADRAMYPDKDRRHGA